MRHAASVMLAMAFRLANAMPMLRCLVGVTRMCSKRSIAAKSAHPVHSNHDCG